MRTVVDADLVSAAHSTAVGGAFEDSLDPFEAAVLRDLRRFTRQAVTRFVDSQPRGAHEAAPGWQLPVPGHLLDTEAAQGKIAATSSKYTTEAAANVGAHMAVEMGLSFDVMNDLLKNVIAAQKGMHIVTAPTDLVGQMMLSLQDSYDKGLSIPHAAAAMRRTGYIHSQAWAERIARTELLGAVNDASLHMVRSATNIPYKLWMATNDNRTRPHHKEADGQIVKVSDPFSVGGWHLDYPGDPSGPGDEVIMCRCTMGYTDDPTGGMTGIGGERIPPTQRAAPAGPPVEVPTSWGRQNGFDPAQVEKWRQEATRVMSSVDQLPLGVPERNHWSAWRDYIGSGHHGMNAVLRGHHKYVSRPEEVATKNENMRQFIDREGVTLTEDTQVFRGTLLKDVENAEGSIHTDPAFMSVSMSYRTSYYFVPQSEVVEGAGQMTGVMLRLQLPKGTRVVAGNSGEYEYVLRPGERYLIVRETHLVDADSPGGVTPSDAPPGKGRRMFDAIIMPPDATEAWAREMLSKLRANE